MADPASDSSASPRKSKRRRRSRRLNPDGTMTLIEHIYEFRRRLGWALIAIVAGGIFGFFWFAYNLGPVPSLGHIITEPYCALPAGLEGGQRVQFGDTCGLLQTVPFEAFMIRLKVGVVAGMVVTAPLWLYQFWAFIAPGLYSKERKYAVTFVGFASLLFAAGAYLAFFLIPGALSLLIGFGGDTFDTALAGSTYVSFLLSLLLIFGVSFELPLVIVMLNQVGVLKYANLKKWRRGIIFALFVFAAFATPGNDPFTMLALAGALTLLCELAIQIARFHDRKLDKSRGVDGWDKLDDDEAAPFEYTPSSIEDEPAPAETGRRGRKSNTDDIT